MTIQTRLTPERGVLGLSLKFLEKTRVALATILLWCRREEKFGRRGMGIVTGMTFPSPKRRMDTETILFPPRLGMTGKTQLFLPPRQQLRISGLMRHMARQTVTLRGGSMRDILLKKSLMARKTDLLPRGLEEFFLFGHMTFMAS